MTKPLVTVHAFGHCITITPDGDQDDQTVRCTCGYEEPVDRLAVGFVRTWIHMRTSHDRRGT